MEEKIPSTITTSNIFGLSKTLDFSNSFINVVLVVLLILPSIWHRLTGIGFRGQVSTSSIFFFFCSARHNVLPNKSLSILTSTKLPLPLLATHFIPSFANVQTFRLDNVFWSVNYFRNLYVINFKCLKFQMLLLKV